MKKFKCSCSLCKLPFEEKIKNLQSCETPAIVYMCTRCSFRFYPKNHHNLPVKCSNCGSPYWFTEKRRKSTI